MKGREILLYINPTAISHLPDLFQSLIAKSSLVIKFFPVLFTQVSALLPSSSVLLIILFLLFIFFCSRSLLLSCGLVFFLLFFLRGL
jgi:hypothetical protein